MELQLLGVTGCPERSVISVNSRPTRQTLLNGPCSQPFQLRAWPWPLRIDLFSRIGKTAPEVTLGDVDSNGHCTVPVVSHDDRPMSITFRVEAGTKSKPPQEEVDKQVNEYFEHHRLNEFIRENFDLLIAQRPDDPFEFLAKRFREAAERESRDPRETEPVLLHNLQEHRACHGPQALRRRARCTFRQALKDGRFGECMSRQTEVSTLEELGGIGRVEPLDMGLPAIAEIDETPSPCQPSKPKLECDDVDDATSAKAACVRAAPQGAAPQARAKEVLSEAAAKGRLVPALVKAQGLTPKHRAQLLLARSSNAKVTKALRMATQETPRQRARSLFSGDAIKSRLETALDRLPSLYEEPVVAAHSVSRAAPVQEAEEQGKSCNPSLMEAPTVAARSESCAAPVEEANEQGKSWNPLLMLQKEDDAADARREAELVEAEKREAARIAAENAAAAERLAAERAAFERAAAERAAEQAAAERAAAEKAAADRAAAEKAAADAEAERVAADRLAAERAAAEKAAADRAAAEKAAADAESERVRAERLAAERAAAETAVVGKAAENAEAEKAADENAAAQKVAAESPENDRLAAESSAAEKAATEKAAAKILADQTAPVSDAIRKPPAGSDAVINAAVAPSVDLDLDTSDGDGMIAPGLPINDSAVSPSHGDSVAGEPVPGIGPYLGPEATLGVDPVTYQNILDEMAANEAMLLKIKEENQAMLKEQSNEMGFQPVQTFGQFMNQQHQVNHANFGSDNTNVIDHSPRLSRFVPDMKPAVGSIPQPSQFATTDASTADTPRLSQFCPATQTDVPGLFHFVPSDGAETVVDDDTPRLSQFVPSYMSGELNMSSPPATPGQKGTPRLTQFVPTHMQEPASGETRMTESQSLRAGTPGLSQFMPDESAVTKVRHSVHFAPEVDALGVSQLVQAAAHSPRLSSFVPVEQEKHRSMSVDDVKYGAAFDSDSLDLAHFVPEEPFLWKKDVGTGLDCTPRLSQFVPQ